MVELVHIMSFLSIFFFFFNSQKLIGRGKCFAFYFANKKKKHVMDLDETDITSALGFMTISLYSQQAVQEAVIESSPWSGGMPTAEQRR